MNIQLTRKDAENLRLILESMKMGGRITVSRHEFEGLYARLNASIQTTDLFNIDTNFSEVCDDEFLDYGPDDPEKPA